LLTPPFWVVPYKFPAASEIRPTQGLAPFMPLNVARVLNVWLASLATLNTVPELLAPPPFVVPYRLPAASEIRPPDGAAPFVILNDARVLSVWLASLATSNTVP